MRSKLGLKGSRLCEMFRMGLPIPPGIVISPEACRKYYENNRSQEQSVQDQVREKLEILEKSIGQDYGRGRNPLLLTLRPGAEIQMPGIIADFHNVGLNDRSVIGLALKTQNEIFAWNAYRKFIEDFAITSLNIHPNRLQAARDKFLKAKARKNLAELTTENLKEMVQEYFKVVLRYTGRKFPQDPEEQLWIAIDSIYNAWKGPRALTYRRMNDCSHVQGTGITLQKMVLCSLNNKCGSGRVFTRNPLNGKKGLFGEFMLSTSLDELNSGKITPKNINELKLTMPNIYEQIQNYAQTLEIHFQDVQDIHFAIEDGNLSLLYSKNAKLAAEAEVKASVDLVNEGITPLRDSIKNMYAPLLQYLPYKIIDPLKGVAGRKVLGKGISGCTASATGYVLFNKDKIADWAKEDKNIIFISKECSTEDYVSLTLVKGYITEHGGATSDASILTRERSIATVVSCADLEVNPEKTQCRIGSHILKEGDIVTINGQSGEIYEGAVPLVDTPVCREYEQLANWVDDIKKMKVLVNANNSEQAALGKMYGAEGVGLCKTEIMYLEPTKLNHFRKAVLTDNLDERKNILEELVQIQKEDIKNIFRQMTGKPCIIRILDPPLNSFLPSDKNSQKVLADELGIQIEKIVQQRAKLAQFNPTLGIRGSRLAVLFPEFVQFEVKAIFIAALEAVEEGLTPVPCIELPMISSAKEFSLVKSTINEIAQETGALGKIKFKVGALIEIPRTALTANELAKEADFIHFGSNDLTQLTCGFSKEDSNLIIDKYIETGVYHKDPFISLDESGVGELMKISIKHAKKAKKNIAIGLSGTHAYDPASIQFCQKIGINEISCPGNKVPVAKMAAAQAFLAETNK